MYQKFECISNGQPNCHRNIQTHYNSHSRLNAYCCYLLAIHCISRHFFAQVDRASNNSTSDWVRLQGKAAYLNMGLTKQAAWKSVCSEIQLLYFFSPIRTSTYLTLLYTWHAYSRTAQAPTGHEPRGGILRPIICTSSIITMTTLLQQQPVDY